MKVNRKSRVLATSIAALSTATAAMTANFAYADPQPGAASAGAYWLDSRYNSILEGMPEWAENARAYVNGSRSNHYGKFFSELYQRAFRTDEDVRAFCSDTESSQAVRMSMVHDVMMESGYLVNGKPYSEVYNTVEQHHHRDRRYRILWLIPITIRGGVSHETFPGRAEYKGNLKVAANACNAVTKAEPKLGLPILDPNEVAEPVKLSAPIRHSSWVRPMSCFLTALHSVNIAGLIAEAASDDPVLRGAARTARGALLQEVDANGNIIRGADLMRDSAFHNYALDVLLQEHNAANAGETSEARSARRIALLEKLTELLGKYDRSRELDPYLASILQKFLSDYMKYDDSTIGRVISNIRQENISGIAQSFKDCTGWFKK